MDLEYVDDLPIYCGMARLLTADRCAVLQQPPPAHLVTLFRL
eukprot:COSAG01_NODE_66468_length_270_cov_0.596491_1_plen_41_part_10